MRVLTLQLVVVLTLVASAPLTAAPRGRPHTAGQTADRPRPARIDPDKTPRPRLRATLTADPITADGVLDERAWQTAPQITDFYQSLPQAGAPATEQTIVRVLYDQEHLYVSAECFDSGPLTISGLEPDFEGANNDVFAMTLDTFHDRRNAFLFMINPSGAVRDEQWTAMRPVTRILYPLPRSRGAV